MSSLLTNQENKILNNNYAEIFLDNISRNITNVLNDTIMFNSGIESFESDKEEEEQKALNEENKKYIDNRVSIINDVSDEQKKVLEKTVAFLDATAKNNRYSGTNIKFTDGTIGYVTQKGFFKLYPNRNIKYRTYGRNGCPKNWQQLDIDFRPEYKEKGSVIPTDPPLIVGTPMTSGQQCGNEGINIQVTTIAPKNSPFLYHGCYEAVPKSTEMEYQNDLGDKTTFSNCKTRA